MYKRLDNLGLKQIWGHEAITLKGHTGEPEGIKVLDLNTFSSTIEPDSRPGTLPPFAQSMTPSMPSFPERLPEFKSPLLYLYC